MFVAVFEVWMMFFEALMMPCARLPGSLTTHCALALPAKSRHRQMINVILVLMLLWILVVVILLVGCPAAASHRT